MLPASRLVRLAKSFRADIRLSHDRHVADARGLLNLLLLGAAMGAEIRIEASGEDEAEAANALQHFLENPTD